MSVGLLKKPIKQLNGTKAEIIALNFTSPVMEDEALSVCAA
jgi:hypothetical protein